MHIKEMLESINSKEAPLSALETVRLNINDLTDRGEKAVLEGLYDKKAQELWRGQLWGDKSAVPVTLEGTAPTGENARPSEYYAQALEELKAFEFYNQETKEPIVREFEDRLKVLAGEETSGPHHM